MRVLVTGGAGFVGKQLVGALLARGYGVRVLDSLVPEVHVAGAPAFPAEVEFVQGSVADPHTVREALRGVDAVFHLAADVGVGKSMYEIDRFVRTNSAGTATLLQEVVAVRSQIHKLVVASSMTVYGEGCGRCPEHGVVEPGLRRADDIARRVWDTLCPVCGAPVEPAPTPETKAMRPTSIYAVTKRDQEELCLITGDAFDIPTIALRYFNIYGVGQPLTNPYTGLLAIFCSRILNGEPALVYEDGRQSRDFVHVSDIVQANLLALEADERGQVFNVSSGELWTVGQVAGRVRDALGFGEVQVSNQFRIGDIRHCHADLAHIRARLGYEPKRSLEDALPEYVAWAREEQSRGAGHDRVDGELESHGLLR